MQQRMQEMREQMARIHETQDPEERQRLMRQHMESMHQAMAAMQEAMRTQGGERQRQQCAQGDAGCQVEQLQMQQQMMGQRMGMMQMMMQQMMEQMQMHQTGTAGDVDSTRSEGHEEHHSDQ